jgi:biotin/methionine sulfoxide reductase
MMHTEKHIRYYILSILSMSTMSVTSNADRAKSAAHSMRALLIGRDVAAAHWGAFDVVRDGDQVVGLLGRAEDPQPSPIGDGMLDAYRSRLRISRPAVRRGWLQRSATAKHTNLRGSEPFVEVSWDCAVDLVSAELKRVISSYGNKAIYGGSYGWASAGRFHHAQSQLHRFLNTVGGYVASKDSYSLGAGQVVMPHVIAPMEYMMRNHHSWDILIRNTQLFVSFGGVPAKNSQIGAGAASFHMVSNGLAEMVEAGCRFVNFSPMRDDLQIAEHALEWVSIRPNTDTAVMLALATEIILNGQHDRDFLHKYCVGFEQWRDYLLGKIDGVVKDADWASDIASVSPDRLRQLAVQLTSHRSLINVSWSLQRADHGEQTFWAAVGLASVIGQIGLPGGGFAVAYGPTNAIGSPHRLMPGPTLPQGENPVKDFIPVARLADMLLAPGSNFEYNGQCHRYPEIRLVYWAGGNPFHHHQNLSRLAQAWTRPETVIVHEQTWNSHARMADIVLPATSSLERADIGYGIRDPLLIAMKQLLPPFGESRDDYTIFSDVAKKMGCGNAFTEGRDTMQWLELLYANCRRGAKAVGIELPQFDLFWAGGGVKLPTNECDVVLFADFRADPRKNALTTPSGRIELFSERVASFRYRDCPGHATWLEPSEWLGSSKVSDYPLHMLSDQPRTKLHSQLDYSQLSLANKIDGREPIDIHPQDAGLRGISNGDIVRVFNDRGSCLAGASIRSDMRPGVVKLSTGAWWDPLHLGQSATLCRHGNPNSLTQDVGTSSLSQGCSAQTCLVQIEKFVGLVPRVRVFDLPDFFEVDLTDCANGMAG